MEVVMFYKKFFNLIQLILLVLLLTSCSNDKIADSPLPPLYNLTFTVDENITIGSVVGLVEPIANSTISFDTSSSIFGIDIFGYIRTKIALDYESISSYDMDIVERNATDIVAIVKVHIEINDLHEESFPQIKAILNPINIEDKVFSLDGYFVSYDDADISSYTISLKIGDILYSAINDNDGTWSFIGDTIPQPKIGDRITIIITDKNGDKYFMEQQLTNKKYVYVSTEGKDDASGDIGSPLADCSKSYI